MTAFSDLPIDLSQQAVHVPDTGAADHRAATP
jgi:hypothetical protein